jgi:hypothetical protein
MPKQETQFETLFDDNTFDKVEHIVDTQGLSYSDARQIVGSEPIYKTPEIKSKTALDDGVSVELGARALALNNVMATYNQLNRTRGANIVSQYPDNEFNTRYRHPEEVREHMGGKAAAMIHFNKEDFSVLNATDELIAAGFDAKIVNRQEDLIKKDLLNKYGPGKAYARDRKRVVQKVAKTAKKLIR